MRLETASSPLHLLAEGAVYFTSDNGTVYALNSRFGRQLRKRGVALPRLAPAFRVQNGF